MFENLAEFLLSHAKGTRKSAILVAPFIKSRTLTGILDVLAPTIAVDVFTRWVPEEIVAGVSDIEIWPLLSQRHGARLFLHPPLHAKYYRFDSTCIVGSANLTARALGLTTPKNLELLELIPNTQVGRFEDVLRSGAFEVDDNTYRAMESATDLISSRLSEPASSPVSESSPSSLLSSTWFPQSLQAQRLFDCYRDRRDLVISSVFELGKRDLEALRPPEGLSQEEFRLFVASQLHQLPVVAHIDARARVPIDRQAGAGILHELGLSSGADATDSWDILAAWLTEFLAYRFRPKVTLTGPAIERSQLIRHGESVAATYPR